MTACLLLRKKWIAQTSKKTRKFSKILNLGIYILCVNEKLCKKWIGAENYEKIYFTIHLRTNLGDFFPVYFSGPGELWGRFRRVKIWPPKFASIRLFLLLNKIIVLINSDNLVIFVLISELQVALKDNFVNKKLECSQIYTFLRFKIIWSAACEK